MSNTTATPTRQSLIADLHLAGKGALSTLRRKSLADLQALADATFGIDAVEAPAFTTKLKGGWIHVFDAEGKRVALVHKKSIDVLVEAAVGEVLRKYVPLTHAGRPVGYVPIDEDARTVVLQAVPALVDVA